MASPSTVGKRPDDMYIIAIEDGKASTYGMQRVLIKMGVSRPSTVDNLEVTRQIQKSS